jgi:hypothetical protein
MSRMAALVLLLLAFACVYGIGYVAVFYMSQQQIAAEMRTMYNDTQRQVGLTNAQSDIDSNTTEFQPPAHVAVSE